MEKKGGVWKILLIIGIVIFALLLCYFSVVLYFYLTKTNDISSKLSLFNLFSDEQVGEMYQKASYEIKNGDTYYGVNVNEKGYLLTIAHNVDEDEDFLAYSKNGAVFNGELVFLDDNYNLAVIKLYDLQDSEKSLSLPYVRLGGLSFLNSSYISLGKTADEEISTAKNVDYTYQAISLTTQHDGIDVVDSIYTNAIMFESENNSYGLFDKRGNLVGLTYAYADTSKGREYFAIPVDLFDNTLNKIVSLNGERLENSLVDNLHGYDMFEFEQYLSYPISVSSSVNQIFYDGVWQVVDENVYSYYASGFDGFYLTNDFFYGETLISEGSMIQSVTYQNISYQITVRLDLVDLLYQANAGDSLTISYQNMQTGEVLKTQILV